MKKRKRKGPGPEESLHREVVQFLRLQYRELLFWHTGNGGARTVAEAGIFKALGVLPGVPDLLFLLWDGRLGAIELKAPGRAANTSEHQEQFRQAMEVRGCEYHVCSEFEQARTVLADWKIRGLTQPPAPGSLPLDVIEGLDARSRGIPGCRAPWATLLRALAYHLETYPDPHWYSDKDARALRSIGAEVSRRADHARAERAGVA